MWSYGVLRENVEFALHLRHASVLGGLCVSCRRHDDFTHGGLQPGRVACAASDCAFFGTWFLVFANHFFPLAARGESMARLRPALFADLIVTKSRKSPTFPLLSCLDFDENDSVSLSRYVYHGLLGIRSANGHQFIYIYLTVPFYPLSPSHAMFLGEDRVTDGAMSSPSNLKMRFGWRCTDERRARAARAMCDQSFRGRIDFPGSGVKTTPAGPKSVSISASRNEKTLATRIWRGSLYLYL